MQVLQKNSAMFGCTTKRTAPQLSTIDAPQKVTNSPRLLLEGFFLVAALRESGEWENGNKNNKKNEHATEESVEK